MMTIFSPRMLGFSLCALTLACNGSDTIISQDDNTPVATSRDAEPHHFIDRTVQDDGVEQDVSTPFLSQANIQGIVSDIPFTPTNTIVLQGRIEFGDRPFATVFVASNVPDMCDHLQRGTLPANGSMLALALVKDDADGPQPGDAFYPGGEQGAVPKPMLHGFFRRLDDQCHIDDRLLPVGATAQKGKGVLKRFGEQGGVKGGTMVFDLGMGFDDMEDELAGQLSGSMSGPLCDAPKLFQNAGAFFNGDIPEGGCVGGL